MRVGGDGGGVAVENDRRRCDDDVDCGVAYLTSHIAESMTR
jgi:hypothetical protein